MGCAKALTTVRGATVLSPKTVFYVVFFVTVRLTLLIARVLKGRRVERMVGKTAAYYILRYILDFFLE